MLLLLLLLTCTHYLNLYFIWTRSRTFFICGGGGAVSDGLWKSLGILRKNTKRKRMRRRTDGRGGGERGRDEKEKRGKKEKKTPDVGNIVRYCTIITRKLKKKKKNVTMDVFRATVSVRNYRYAYVLLRCI